MCKLGCKHRNHCVWLVLAPVKTDRLETASEVKLALHHVKEDGNRGFTQLDLRNQRHLQNRTHHLRDKLDLVWTCRMFRRNKLACLNPLDCLFKIFSVSFFGSAFCLWYFCWQVHQHREYRLSATSLQSLFVSNSNFYVFLWGVYNFYFGGSISKSLYFHLCSPNLQSFVQSQHWIEANISDSLVYVTKPGIKRSKLMNKQRVLRNTSTVRWQTFIQGGVWELKILSQRCFLNCPATN